VRVVRASRNREAQACAALQARTHNEKTLNVYMFVSGKPWTTD
jgi:hypothetical protein